jgi:hypothetical protein
LIRRTDTKACPYRHILDFMVFVLFVVNGKKSRDIATYFDPLIRMMSLQMKSAFIDGFRLLEDLSAEVLAESLRGEEIDLSTESVGELLLDLDELEQADGRLGREVDQDVDVAVVPGRAVDVRAEKGDALDLGAVRTIFDGAPQACCKFFFHHDFSVDKRREFVKPNRCGRGRMPCCT